MFKSGIVWQQFRQKLLYFNPRCKNEDVPSLWTCEGFILHLLCHFYVGAPCVHVWLGKSVLAEEERVSHLNELLPCLWRKQSSSHLCNCCLIVRHIHISAAASAAVHRVGEFIHYNENKGNLLSVSETLLFVLLFRVGLCRCHRQCAALRHIKLLNKLLHCWLLQENGEADAKLETKGDYLSVSDG